MLERGKCNGRTHPEVERIVSDRRLFALVEGEDVATAPIKRPPSAKFGEQEVPH